MFGGRSTPRYLVKSSGGEEKNGKSLREEPAAVATLRACEECPFNHSVDRRFS